MTNDYNPGWYSPQPGLLAGYTQDLYGDTHLVTLIHYPPITAKVIRATSLRTLHQQPDPNTGHHWPPGPPPTPEQLRSAWQIPEPSPQNNDPDHEALTKPELTRRPGEPPAHFYRRVARAYQLLTQSTNQPTKRISQIAGVSQAAATSWVHRARTRGYIAPGVKAS